MGWNGQKKISGAVAGQSLMIALSFEGAWVRSPAAVKIFWLLRSGWSCGKTSNTLPLVKSISLQLGTEGRGNLVGWKYLQIYFENRSN